MKKLISILTFLLIIPFSFAGNDYQVWQDTDGDHLPDLYKGNVHGIDGTIDVISAYNYSSASSHMTNPTPEAYKSKVWIYEYNGDFFVGMFHNIDNSGSLDNKVDWFIKFFNTQYQLLFSDENHEVNYLSNDIFHAKWHYWSNTDGAIFKVEDTGRWMVEIYPDNMGDIKTWEVASANGNSVMLDMQYPTFIIRGSCYPIPEFSTLAATITLGALAGFIFYKKRK